AGDLQGGAPVAQRGAEHRQRAARGQGHRAGAGEQRPGQPADQHQHRNDLPRHELPRTALHPGCDQALRPDARGRRAADRRRRPARHRPRPPAGNRGRGPRVGDDGRRGIDPDLPQDSEAVLARLGSISKEVQGQDGRWYVRQVLPYRTRDSRIEGGVIPFSDVAAEALQEARLYAEAIVNTVREPLLVLDSDLRVLSANRSFYQTFRLSPEETVT